MLDALSPDNEEALNRNRFGPNRRRPTDLMSKQDRERRKRIQEKRSSALKLDLPEVTTSRPREENRRGTRGITRGRSYGTTRRRW